MTTAAPAAVPVCLTLSLAALLGGCSAGGAQPLATTSAAASAACRQILAALPSTLLDLPRQSATDPATGATPPGQARWGEGTLTLQCGVPSPPPSTDLCLSVNDLDWLFTETPGQFRFTTFGTRPTVTVLVADTISRERAPGALAELSAALGELPRSRECLG